MHHPRPSRAANGLRPPSPGVLDSRFVPWESTYFKPKQQASNGRRDGLSHCEIIGFSHNWRVIMTRCAVQFVSKPNPGVDFGKFIAQVKTGLALWEKHGAAVSLWSVTGGEVGNIVFVAMFENFSAYGACMDKLNADPEFRAYVAQITASGLGSWVRSNVSRELA